MVLKGNGKRSGLMAAGLAGAGFVLIPAIAIASHGKAGLWEVTTTVSMPAMPQMSSAQMAQMQAMGMRMPMGHAMTVRRCMTAEEVASDRPPPRSKDCTFSNIKVDGHTFSGDETCTGEVVGEGHFSMTYDSDEHYTGTSTMNGTANGHPANMNASFEGKWISADCGSVK